MTVLLFWGYHHFRKPPYSLDRNKTTFGGFKKAAFFIVFFPPRHRSELCVKCLDVGAVGTWQAFFQHFFRMATSWGEIYYLSMENLSIYEYVWIYIQHQKICENIWISLYLSIYLSIYFSIVLSFYFSIVLSFDFSIFLSIYKHIYVYIYILYSICTYRIYIYIYIQ